MKITPRTHYNWNNFKINICREHNSKPPLVKTCFNNTSALDWSEENTQILKQDKKNKKYKSKQIYM